MLCKWECSFPGCTSTAVGSGGAIGLLSIGWFFATAEFDSAGGCYCPAHRPDKVACQGEGENHNHPCSLCRGEDEANRIQGFLQRALASEELRNEQLYLTHVCVEPGKPLCATSVKRELFRDSDLYVSPEGYQAATCENCRMKAILHRVAPGFRSPDAVPTIKTEIEKPTEE